MKIMFIALVGFLLFSSYVAIAEEKDEPPNFEVDVAVMPQKIYKDKGEKGQFLVFQIPKGGYCYKAVYSVQTDDPSTIDVGIFNTYNKDRQFTRRLENGGNITRNASELGIYNNITKQFDIFIDNIGQHWECKENETNGWEKIPHFRTVSVTGYEDFAFVWCNRSDIILERPKETDSNLFGNDKPLSLWEGSVGTIWVGNDTVIGEHQIRVTLSCNNNGTWSYFTGTGRFYVTDWGTENGWIIPLGAAILGAIIGGLFAISGGFIGSFVQRWLQNRQWKREYNSINVGRIYEPCYDEISSIIASLKNPTYLVGYIIGYKENGWKTIRTNYLATILQLKNKKLYEELEKFYAPISDKNRWDNLDREREIAKEIFLNEIKKRWHDKDSADRDIGKQKEIFIKLGHNNRVVDGFIKGLSIKEIFKEGIYEDWISSIKPAMIRDYGNYFTFFPEIFDIVYAEVNSDSRIIEIRKNQQELIKQAEEIKKMLEKEIVESQLQ